MKYSFSFFGVFSKFLILAILGWVAFPADSVQAKIYKYKDEKGVTHFTDDAGKIPLRYRDQGSVKRFRGVPEPSPKSAREVFPDKSKSKDDKSAGKKDVGLNPQEKALVEQAIMVFQAGVALADRYKDAVPNASNGRGLTIAIQGTLPIKENLANQLQDTKSPVLKEAYNFLKQSIVEDEKDKGIGAGLKTRIASIMSRVVSEGKQQAALIQKLEQALDESAKKKAEAKKRKAEEAREKAEEARKKAEEASKKLEEAKQKEDVYNQ